MQPTPPGEIHPLAQLAMRPTSPEEAQIAAWHDVLQTQNRLAPHWGEATTSLLFVQIYLLRALLASQNGSISDAARLSVGALLLLETTRLDPTECGSVPELASAKANLTGAERRVRDLVAWRCHLAALPEHTHQSFTAAATAAYCAWTETPPRMERLVHAYVKAVREHLPKDQQWDSRSARRGMRPARRRPDRAAGRRHGEASGGRDHQS